MKATRTGLVVKLRSTSKTTIRVKVAARELKRRYKPVTRTLAPGARVKVKLVAPRALRKRIAHRRIRRPKLAVTNVANGLELTLRPRL